LVKTKKRKKKAEIVQRRRKKSKNQKLILYIFYENISDLSFKVSDDSCFLGNRSS
jgi:hypothetical protein